MVDGQLRQGAEAAPLPDCSGLLALIMPALVVDHPGLRHRDLADGGRSPRKRCSPGRDGPRDGGRGRPGRRNGCPGGPRPRSPAYLLVAGAFLRPGGEKKLLQIKFCFWRLAHRNGNCKRGKTSSMHHVPTAWRGACRNASTRCQPQSLDFPGERDRPGCSRRRLADGIVQPKPATFWMIPHSAFCICIIP